MRDEHWPTHVLDGEPDDRAWLDREWLITNGTGAYAAGTAAGCNTRRYHGLLVAATRPPVRRVVALNQMWEQLLLRDQAGVEQPLEFTTCLFRAGNAEGRAFAPHGSRMLNRFEREIGVAWHYQWGDLTFTRELRLHWKQQAATLRYRVNGLTEELAESATLRLLPMLTLRDFHGLVHRDPGNPFKIATTPKDTLNIERWGASATLHCRGANFATAEDWWYGLFYPIDAQRGQDDHEDYFVPGAFELELTPGRDVDVTLTVALGEKPVDAITDDTKRAAHLLPIAETLEKVSPGQGRVLAIAADDFVCDRTIRGQKLQTILAGFPWFADWGRDTFIALPGLLLTTGRYDEARAVLKAFAAAIKDGLVPNRFDDYDDDAAHYNTVDASLWFIHAAMQYVAHSGDDDAWNDWLAEACVTIADAYIRGTHDIRMAGDCLIEAGNAHTQLTWMDAACGGVVFTPRFGKAVEINALWFNALAGLCDTLPDDHKDKVNHYTKLLGRIKRAFPKVFLRDDGLGLYDHVWVDDAGNEHRDASIRPNQVFVASLPHSPLPMTKCKTIMDVVKQKLLTPMGLRTLPPDDPAYHHHYIGEQFRRDEAYHQGTVWPWLIGPYAEAVLRTGKFSAKARSAAHDAIEPLLSFMLGQGLGQLHEIHEADPPHLPRGCFAQAWSVAELVRVLGLIESSE